MCFNIEMYLEKVFLSENNDLPFRLKMTPFSAGGRNPYSRFGREVLLTGKRGVVALKVN